MGVTDVGNEWIVEVDANDNLVDKINRDVAHDPDNLRLHREVMILLYTNSSHEEFVLQHRSMLKKQLPGFWTLSVTGHVDFADLSDGDKDGYMSAAKRETFEELGVNVFKGKFVGKIIQKIPQNWAMMGVVTGEYEGELKLDFDEVSEIKIYNKNTISQVSDFLTPGARECLIYLGILNK